MSNLLTALSSGARAAAVLALAFSAVPGRAQLGAAGVQFLDQESPGMPGVNDSDEQLAYALAAGDFDGDGYVDLALGAPFEGVYGDDAGGTVTVVRGSAGGLDPLLGAQLWSRGLGLLAGDVGVGDTFGNQLAAADFDDDGLDDLAIAVPGAELVFVLRGTGTGLTHVGHLAVQRGTHGIPGNPEGDSFGGALAVGDLNGDGFPDLAIGLPGYDHPGGGAPISAAGAVVPLYGSAAGLSASPGGGAPGKLWTKADLGLVPRPVGLFGSTLAVGDFDADGYDDLAIGAPNEDLSLPVGPEVHQAGLVYVLRGSPGGLTGTGGRVFHRGQPGFYGNPANQDHMGASLAAGDFDGDGDHDLAIGVPGADLLAEGVGIAYVVAGSPGTGLSNMGAALLTKGTIGAGIPSQSDVFGAELAVADFDGDGLEDLVVSAIQARSPQEIWSGVVWLLPGSPHGPTTATRTLHHHLALPGTEAVGLGFGKSFAPGDFDGNGRSDLAVGVTRWRTVGAPVHHAYGAVDVFLTAAALFADGFESGNLGGWSLASP